MKTHSGERRVSHAAASGRGVRRLRCAAVDRREPRAVRGAQLEGGASPGPLTSRLVLGGLLKPSPNFFGR